jgi:hypothetical protein
MNRRGEALPLCPIGWLAHADIHAADRVHYRCLINAIGRTHERLVVGSPPTCYSG